MLFVSLIALVISLVIFKHFSAFSLEPSYPVAVPTPTPDPIANWQTNVNAEGRFSLRYPPSWKFQGNTFENKRYIERADNPEEANLTRVSGTVTIDTSKITEDEVFDPHNSFWKISTGEETIACQGPSSAIYYNEPKEITLGNIRAMVQISHPLCSYGSVTTNQMSKTFYIVRPSDNAWVIIVLYYDNTNPEKDATLAVFDTILSTFSFVDAAN